MNTYIVTVCHEVSAKNIMYQICAAVEGGIGYWAESFKLKSSSIAPTEAPWYSDTALYTGDFTIEVIEHEEHKEGRGVSTLLTPDSLRRGLHLMAEKDPKQFKSILDEDGDAITADLLIQYCAFGEVIYG